MHFTKCEIEAYQVNHLETSLISHSNIKLALHNTRVPIRSQAMLLSLGCAWESTGELSKYTDA